MSLPFNQQLRHTIDQWIHFAPSLGVDVCVYDSNFGFWNHTAGYRSLNPHETLETNETFYIYSITKTYTATVVLALTERGLISLNKPIATYLSGLELPDSITVQRLLNHTAGIPNYAELPDYVDKTREKPGQPWSFDYVIDRTCKGQIDFNPGEGWHYSNTGYMLLLLMIEAVTGKSFAENVNELVINKIGFKSTYVAEEVDSGKVTNGYCRQLNIDRKMENITSKYHPWWCKTALLASTSKETTRFYQALFGGELLSQGSLARMTAAVSVGQPGDHFMSKPSYGLGMMIDPENRFGTMYGHGGNGPGFNTWSTFYPDLNGRSVGLTIFCNTSMGGHPLFLARELLDIISANAT